MSDQTALDGARGETRPVHRDWFAVSMLVFVMAATAGLLGYDIYDTFGRDNAANELMRRTGPVVTRPPADGDQVRPYLERGRPVAPGRTAPPGVRGPSISEAAPMTFERDGDVLRGEGTITFGALDAFERALSALPDDIEAGKLQLVLHSPGGIVPEAVALARRIREVGLSTRVDADGYCASSCPILFAAGVKRSASKDAWIGVHRVYVDAGIFGNIDDGIGEAQRVAAEVQGLLDGFGVDPLVWTHAMRTPKQSLYFFTPAELEELKLATKVD